MDSQGTDSKLEWIRGSSALPAGALCTLRYVSQMPSLNANQTCSVFLKALKSLPTVVIILGEVTVSLVGLGHAMHLAACLFFPK